ncbi:MAG: hypothetical protein PWP24_1850, partial [Clostridiales bacterium]|nr:hypothetical protein [Clostridiales bacterium]
MIKVRGKKIIMLFMLIVAVYKATSAVPVYATSAAEIHITDTQLTNQFKHVVGVLLDYTSMEEKSDIYEMLYRIDFLQQKRQIENQFIATEEETELRYHLCAYLDGMTLKYIAGAKQQLEYGNPFSTSYTLPEENQVLDNLKSSLSKKDYARLVRLYEKCREEMTVSRLGRIYQILSSYKNLDADRAYKNLFSTNMPMIAEYLVDSDTTTIEYLNPKLSGLSNISDKQKKLYFNIWERITNILPADGLKSFGEFDVASDGKYSTLAYVDQMDQTGTNWKICIDPSDVSDGADFNYTLVHEYGHYLSLNNTQVTYFAADASLQPSFLNYTDASMVANNDSYLNRFYHLFWENIQLDKSADNDNPLFYVRHYNEFV